MACSRCARVCSAKDIDHNVVCLQESKVQQCRQVTRLKMCILTSLVGSTVAAHSGFSSNFRTNAMLSPAPSIPMSSGHIVQRPSPSFESHCIIACSHHIITPFDCKWYKMRETSHPCCANVHEYCCPHQQVWRTLSWAFVNLCICMLSCRVASIKILPV